jgi:DNA repair protein RadD
MAKQYKLRDYQDEAATIGVRGLYNEKHPFILQLATGAGKSLVIAEMCHRIDEPILILQPSKEILEQNYLKLVSYDPMIDAGIYSASKGRKEIAKFTFATIGSIYKQPENFKHFKYVIIDECHGVNPKNLDGMLTSFLAAIDCKHVCGLTATPYRIDTLWKRDRWGNLYSNAALKMINRIGRKPFFRKILYKIETQDLIDKGYLSPIKYFRDDGDWSSLKVNSTGADFTAASLQEYTEKPNRLDRIVQAVEYSDKNNKRTLIFCYSLAQAEKAMKRVNALGIRASMVSGSTPLVEREQMLAYFKSGRIKHLFNVGVLTTGFDAPELDCIVMARPTMSLALYYQIIGRGVRLDPNDPNKILQVYDLVGVVERLGRVETIRVMKEDNGFRDEVYTEVGRMDNIELYSFKIPANKLKKKGKK